MGTAGSPQPLMNVSPLISRPREAKDEAEAYLTDIYKDLHS